MANETLLEYHQLSNTQGICPASVLSMLGNPVANDLIAIFGGDANGLYPFSTPIGTGLNPTAIAKDPLGRFVYTANYYDQTVTVQSKNQLTGVLSLVETKSIPDYDYGVVVDPLGLYLYVTIYSGSIAAYSINQSTGALTYINTYSGGTCAYLQFFETVRISGQSYLFVGESSYIQTYSINDLTGALTYVSQIAHGTVPPVLRRSVNGLFLYACFSGLALVKQYSINQSNGTLTFIGNTSTGTAPQDIAFFSNTFMFVNNKTDNTISSYSLDVGTGVPTPITTTATGTTPYGLAICNNRLFVTNSGDNTVSEFIIDSGTGALALVGAYATATLPQVMISDTIWSCLYVVNNTSKTISQYYVDGKIRTYGATSGGNVNYTIGATKEDSMANLAAAILSDGSGLWNAYVCTGLDGLITTAIAIEEKTTGYAGSKIYGVWATQAHCIVIDFTGTSDYSSTAWTTISANIPTDYNFGFERTVANLTNGEYHLMREGELTYVWLSSGSHWVLGESIDSSSIAVSTSSGLVGIARPLNIAPLGSCFYTGNLPIGLYFHTATLLPDGKILIVGGTDNAGNILADACLYDPSTGLFTSTGSLLVARCGHTAILLTNGKVLVVGGVAQTTYLTSAELYDPNTRLFTSTGPMITARSFHPTPAVMLSNGNVLVTGGRNSGGFLSTSEIYNPTTGIFTATGSMMVARYEHTVTVLSDGKVLVTGGYNGSGLTLDSAEIYNPITGLFTTTGSMGISRRHQSATLLFDGTVLIATGVNGVSNPIYLASAELYNPITGLFTSTGALSVARYSHGDILLHDGRVLISGGGNATDYLTSNEIYDSGTGTFSTIQSLKTARSWPTITILLNGNVLIAAGQTTGNGTTETAEIFNPGTVSSLGTVQGILMGLPRLMAAQSNSLSTTSGVLSGVTKQLSGTMDAISTTTGRIEGTSRTLTGVTIVESSISGSFDFVRVLKSAVDSVSTITGILIINKNLQANISVTSTVGGNLTAEPILKSTIHAISNVSGDIINKQLSGSTAAITTVSGETNKNSGILVKNDAALDFSLLVPGGMTEDGLHRYVYIGNSDDSSGRGIWAYSRHPITGHLTYIGNYGPLLKNVYSLTNDVRGRFIYACDGQYIYIYEINIFGGLTYLSSVSLSSGQNPYIIQTDPTGEFLHCITHNNEFVLTFHINATTGLLTLVDFITTGTSAIACTIDCTNHFLYVGCTDGIWVYTRNLTTGILTFVETIVPAAPLSSIICDQNLHLFVAEDTVIEKYDIAFDTGHLTYSSDIMNVPNVLNLGLDINGRFLYALCPGTPNKIIQYNAATLTEIAPDLEVDCTPNGCLTIQNSLYIADSVNNQLETWHIGGRMLASSVAAVSAVTGNVEANPSIGGTVTSITTTMGNICRNPNAVKGVSHAVSTTTGTLNGLHQTLQATVAAISTASGVVDVPKLLQSTSDSVSTVDGDLIYPVPLIGTSDSISTTTGKLTWALDLRSQVESISTVTGPMIADVPIQGSSVAISTVHGDLLKPCELASVVTSVSTVTGDIPVSDYCKGATSAVSTIAGILAGLPRTIEGQSDGVSTIVGRLSAVCPLASTIHSISTTSGILLAPPALQAFVSAVSTTTGRLRSSGALKAMSAAISSISNALLPIHRPIKSTIHSVSTARTTFYQAPMEVICEAESFVWADITLVLKPKSELYTGRIGFGDYVLPLQPTSDLGIWQSPASVNFTIYRQFVTRFNGYLFDSKQNPVDISNDIVEFVIPDIFTKIGLHLDDTNGLIEFELTPADFVALTSDLRVVFPFEIYRTTLAGEKYLHITGILTVEA